MAITLIKIDNANFDSDDHNGSGLWQLQQKSI